jgi:TetR/AcrR family transcriptional repressor of lmrAB and yxaGH operons
VSSGVRRTRAAPSGEPKEAMETARNRIVPLIARAFRRYGYEAASMSVLSTETKLGRSSLYHYFPGGKEDMAMAVLDLAGRFVRVDLMAKLLEPDTRRNQVDKFIGKLREYYEGGTVGCLYGVLTLHDCPHHVGDRVAALTQDWITALADYLKSRGDPSARANAGRIVRHLQGGLVVSLATRDPRQFEAALDDLRPILSGRDRP